MGGDVGEASAHPAAHARATRPAARQAAGRGSCSGASAGAEHPLCCQAVFSVLDALEQWACEYGNVAHGAEEAEMHACLGAFLKSVPVLEAYLERYYPDWREGEAFEEGGASNRSSGRSGSAMTTEEAYEILGLEEGASEEAVREAHHRLMVRIHPDQGGSNWLAARINEARDILLGP